MTLKSLVFVRGGDEDSLSTRAWVQHGAGWPAGAVSRAGQAWPLARPAWRLVAHTVAQHAERAFFLVGPTPNPVWRREIQLAQNPHLLPLSIVGVRESTLPCGERGCGAELAHHPC